MNPLLRFLVRPYARFKARQALAMPSAHGIVEHRFVPIGGIDQWISIRGENWANPLLVILHGGPGSTYSMFSPHLRTWEKHFTVVQWDQRGAGKTFRKNGPSGSSDLSFERLTNDAIALIAYLRDHLAHDKVILLGSSVGSLTGLLVAKRCPEWLHAYVGTDQNSPNSMNNSYQLMHEWLRVAGKTKPLTALEALWKIYPNWTITDFNRFNQLGLKASDTQAIPNFALDVMFPAMLNSPQHTLRDLRDIMAGMEISLAALLPELLDFDIGTLGTSFEVPFVVIQGDTDVFTPAGAAKAYFEQVQAPHKGFSLIKRTGHLAALTRPDEFLQALTSHILPLARSIGAS